MNKVDSVRNSYDTTNVLDEFVFNNVMNSIDITEIEIHYNYGNINKPHNNPELIYMNIVNSGMTISDLCNMNYEDMHNMCDAIRRSIKK